MKKIKNRKNEKSFVLLAPDEVHLNKLEKICRKYKKTEEEVSLAAFPRGFSLVGVFRNKNFVKNLRDYDF